MLKIKTNHKLPHFDSRPRGTKIDTIVIHSIYGKGYKQILAPSNSIKLLRIHKVSAHYLIDRKGVVFRLVPEIKCAWHAGVSQMPFRNDKRTKVNRFSIGIELIGTPWGGFSKAQYKALAQLVTEITRRHPIVNLVGHDEIAPERKKDPGKKFKWRELIQLLKLSSVKLRTVTR